MIFITLGSQKFQFNRLLIEVDNLLSNGVIKDQVFAQIGYSDYKPLNYKYKKFLDRDEFSLIMEKSDVVITHGGTGAIISAVKMSKKVIAIPRLAKFDEHVDDHQIQLIRQFDELDIIEPCFDITNLSIAYGNLDKKKYKSYKSNTNTIIKSIERFIEGNN